MSLVTSAMILTAWMEDDSFLVGNVIEDPECTPQHFEKLDDRVISESGGGYKHLQFEGIYAAGFNYVPVGDLESWFQNLPWSDRDQAILVMERENDGFFVSRKDPS